MHFLLMQFIISRADKDIFMMVASTNQDFCKIAQNSLYYTVSQGIIKLMLQTHSNSLVLLFYWDCPLDR